MKDTVGNALMNGMTGDQNISYLNTHGYSFMKKRVIPLSVSDEMRLPKVDQNQEQMIYAILLSDINTNGTVSAHKEHIVRKSWTHLNYLKLFESKVIYDNLHHQQ